MVGWGAARSEARSCVVVSSSSFLWDLGQHAAGLEHHAGSIESESEAARDPRERERADEG